eukprot:2719615-Pyramimonas_sp.AAC.1
MHRSPFPPLPLLEKCAPPAPAAAPLVRDRGSSRALGGLHTAIKPLTRPIATAEFNFSRTPRRNAEAS